jgi:hypothetical protein
LLASATKPNDQLDIFVKYVSKQISKEELVQALSWKRTPTVTNSITTPDERMQELQNERDLAAVEFLRRTTRERGQQELQNERDRAVRRLATAMEIRNELPAGTPEFEAAHERLLAIQRHVNSLDSELRTG